VPTVKTALARQAVGNCHHYDVPEPRHPSELERVDE
jgi:hypothetical protein